LILLVIPCSPTGRFLVELPLLSEQKWDHLGGAIRRGIDGYSDFSSAQWIERVVIKNFRPIGELDLDFSVVENGSGKSRSTR
jgi:hypothetical protein